MRIVMIKLIKELIKELIRELNDNGNRFNYKHNNEVENNSLNWNVWVVV